MSSNSLYPDPRQQRAALLDRIYRRISQLDDETLVQLDALTDTAERLEFTVEEADESPRRVTRRGFLTAALLAGILTSTGGLAAALISQTQADNEAPIPTPPQVAGAPTLQGEPIAASPLPPSATPDTARDQLIADLRQQLADTQGERLALRSDLDATRAALEAARTEQGQLSAELEARNSDVAFLQQLVALYDQLEATGLDAVLLAGLGPVGLALLAVQSGRDVLSSGIEEAAARLATVEVQSPAIANGLLWLEEQVNLLAATLQSLEDALSGVVEPVAPVAQQVGDFIGQILDLLPFGVGEQLRRGLEAIAVILTHIPELVASINPVLITPLRQWVSPEEGKGLVAEVVEPISQNLITPAQGMVTDTAALHTTYTRQIAEPAQLALDSRAAIRNQIAALTGAVPVRG